MSEEIIPAPEENDGANDLQLLSLDIRGDSYDYKIEAQNVLATVTVEDYLEIAESIKDNNDLQRRKVANNSTVYALLKDDIESGCIIPAIVLAIDLNDVPQENKKLDREEIKSIVRNNAKRLKLLDGLQRTNIMLDLKADLSDDENKTPEEIEENQKKLKFFIERELRLEIYISINRFGILYRMLTLNTGQTPMTLRHQIEMLYSDLYVKEKGGILLLRENTGGSTPVKFGRYKFSDVIEGVTSYIDGSEYSLNRFDLLDYVKSLKKLSAEDQQEDIFESYLSLYHHFLNHIIQKSNNWSFDYGNLLQEELEFFPVVSSDGENVNRVSPFASSAEGIFIKSQIFTGLGAALSYLKGKQIINNIDDVKAFVENIKFLGTPEAAMNLLVVRLEQLRKDSRKIGESQRTFFKFFFISLFNSTNEDEFLLFDSAIASAYQKTF